jgi:hypothetical protein
VSSRAAFRYAEGTSVCSSGRRSTPPLLNAEGQTKKEEVKELLKTNAHLKVLLFAVGLLTVVSSRAGEDGIIEIRKNPQPQTSDVVVLSGPVIITNLFGDIRNRNIGAHNIRVVCPGYCQREEALMRALRWLKKNQQPDGSWPQQKIAMTGLAILTFLAHGEPPRDSREFGATVQKALEFLLKNQRADGKFNGMDDGEYAHPIATYALCEAYGMTLNPDVKAAAEKALVPIIKGQHPTGGWTYKMHPGPEANGGFRDDTSFMGWCVQALKAAHLAKIQVNGLERAMKLAVKGFKANAHPSGGFGYIGPGTGGLTSVGCLCMQLLGASNENEVKKALDVIDTWVPTFSSYASVPEEERRFYMMASPQYYFYYATQCKFHQGGRHWDNWNKAMKPRYVKAQLVEENAIKDAKGIDRDIGWWENADAHSDRPVMDTCLAASNSWSTTATSRPPARKP